jgi:DNA-directed RNA polymerase subunit N (RpoN/RPB10)
LKENINIIIDIINKMIIPIKCFTCGKVLADKYSFYKEEVRRIKLSRNIDINKVIYLTKDFSDKTPEGEVLDDLGLKHICCRRHMLSHVDIE